jgi:three-Cys-motif partner protein
LSFFKEEKEQSVVKAAIVQKYFWAWAKVMANRAERILYLDLFAGPGRYENGTKSTPLLILESAISDPKMRDRLITIFNDKDVESVRSLETEISKLDNIKTLGHTPIVMNKEVGTEMVKLFEQNTRIPTLFFIDPWGYKGLSLQLINSVLQNWGCECIIFFNYNRINMGLPNDNVNEALNALFGESRADKLRDQIKGLNPDEREVAILEGISQALKEMGGQFILPFTFKNELGTRTKHHLIFVSKHQLGYTIMKDIMASMSSEHVQGVPTFEYNPFATKRQPLLFELNRPLDDLPEMLLEKFAGQTLSCLDIFDFHHVGHRYVASNYKTVLGQLEQSGVITCNPNSDKRPKRKGIVTFADKTLVTFPPRKK